MKQFTGQLGFTLLEMLIATAITGIICAAAAMGINQLMRIDNISLNHQKAVIQIQSAVDDISRDVLQSQTISVTGTTTLTLAVYTGLNNFTPTTTPVIYSLTAGGALQRNTIILIPAAAATFTWNQTTNVLTFSLTAVVGSGSSAGSETRNTQINVRAP
jgi:prepilin-type N-terminal cleavage/methylation domain-containing protein